MNSHDAKEIINDFLSKKHEEIYNNNDYHVMSSYSSRDLTLTISVDRGGASGGNCWGDDADEYIGSSKEFSFDVIFDLFELICPDLPFFKARILAKECMSEIDTSYSEYYGNYTNSVRYVYDLKYILDHLIKNDYISE